MVSGVEPTNNPRHIMNRIATLRRALDLIKESSKQILAQVDGPAGVGKTTLMEKIAGRGYSVIDLDVFDEQASKEMGLDDGWKSSDLYSDKLLAKVHKLRQRLLDNWLEENDPDRSIVFGIHTEGKTRYKVNAAEKILLTDDVSKIVDRRMKRDDLDEGDRSSLRKETLDHIKELKALGFVEMKADEVLAMFSRISLDSSDKRTFSDNDKTYNVEKLWHLTRDNDISEIVTENFEEVLSDPVWGEKGNEYSALDVLSNREKYADDYERIIAADLRYPIMIYKDHVVDGVHRLAKAYVKRLTKIKAQVISKEQMKEALLS